MGRLADQVGRLARTPWCFFPVQWLLTALVWLVTGWRIEGRENLPRSGPVLVVSNHLNNADPFLLSIATPRPLAFMAKIELFRIPVVAQIITAYGNFPIDRGSADRAAIRHALDLLAEGRALGMFPEGTRSRTATMARGLTGVGLLVARSGAPVVPVGIFGTESLNRLWPRPVVTIRYGRPFTIERSAGGRVDHQAVVDRIMREVAALVPPQYRGVYGSEAAPDA